jgi:hypothetical protein
MCEDCSNFGNKERGCCITATQCPRFPSSPGHFWPTIWLSSPKHPTHLTWPPATLLCFHNRRYPPFRHKWGERGRITVSAEHPHRTRLQDTFKRMAESLGWVQMHKRGLLQWQCSPVGPRLAFDQTEATAPEIMGSSVNLNTYGWYHLVFQLILINKRKLMNKFTALLVFSFHCQR